MKRIPFFLALFLIALPFAASANPAGASRAGTDDYLRNELGYTDAQLSAKITTENREPFELAVGEIAVEDPLGDVLDRTGRTTALQVPWADIASARLDRNDAGHSWDITVKFGAPVPKKQTMKAQLFVYMDTDGQTDNNKTEGVGIQTDAEFTVQYNQERGWYTDFRWYNPAADFWAINKETASTFEIIGDKITLRIPFEEVSASVSPNWRIVMGISDKEKTQIDAAPTIGFPLPKTTEPTLTPTSSNQPTNVVALYGLITVSALTLAYGIRLVTQKDPG